MTCFDCFMSFVCATVLFASWCRVFMHAINLSETAAEYIPARLNPAHFQGINPC